MVLYFITGNQNKFREATAILGPGLERVELDLPEIQDIDAKRVIEEKLGEARKHQPGDFIVEDVSLELECLNGLPGPLIKWFLKTVGYEGLADIAKKYDNNRARAIATYGYYSNGEIKFFEGIVDGKIVDPRGDNKFGWDPIFQPDGYKKTFAEMTVEEKNEISHRRLALNKLKEYLRI